jgi:multicomponent Na+:H+ antiporter subunit E
LHKGTERSERNRFYRFLFEVPNKMARLQMASASMIGTVVVRGIGLLAVWMLIAGASLSGLPAGIVAAAIAAWVSLILQQPGTDRIRFVPLIRLILRMLFESVLAGTDIARRVLDPRLPLNPGFIRHTPALAPGPPRAVFNTMTCLVPGTLSVGTAPDGALLVHSLDVAQYTAAGLARDEAALLNVLGRAQASA